MPDQEKIVRDIMVDVFDYPHVPYWFTVRQVAGILKKSMSGGKCLQPFMSLIFDEKYNLLGYVEVRDILLGIRQAASAGNEDLKGALSDARAAEALATLAEKPTSSLMTPVRLFADPEDTLTDIAEIILSDALSIIPVLENRKKLVGIVRSADIFDHLSAVFFRA